MVRLFIIIIILITIIILSHHTLFWSMWLHRGLKHTEKKNKTKILDTISVENFFKLIRRQFYLMMRTIKIIIIIIMFEWNIFPLLTLLAFSFDVLIMITRIMMMDWLRGWGRWWREGGEKKDSPLQMIRAVHQWFWSLISKLWCSIFLSVLHPMFSS